MKVRNVTSEAENEGGSSNSHPGDIYGTDKTPHALIHQVPEVGSDWWIWNFALGLWEWATVKSVNEIADGVIVFSRVASPDQLGRLRTFREGWGYQPVTERDRQAVPLRDLFPEINQGALFG
jgi:hypothetical protein